MSMSRGTKVSVLMAMDASPRMRRVNHQRDAGTRLCPVGGTDKHSPDHAPVSRRSLVWQLQVDSHHKHNTIRHYQQCHHMVALGLKLSQRAKVN